MSTYTASQKALYAHTKNCSVLLKVEISEFDINGTNSLRADVSSFLCYTRKSKEAFTLGARVLYSLDTNVNTLFSQVYPTRSRPCTRAQKWATGHCVQRFC